jgi:hypothetical protein
MQHAASSKHGLNEKYILTDLARKPEGRRQVRYMWEDSIKINIK